MIYVRPVKNAQRIFLEFDYNERLVARIRDIEGAIWETCYFMWHIPFRDDFMSKPGRFLVRSLNTNLNTGKRTV